MQPAPFQPPWFEAEALRRHALAPSTVVLAAALVLSWIALVFSGPHGDRWRHGERLSARVAAQCAAVAAIMLPRGPA